MAGFVPTSTLSNAPTSISSKTGFRSTIPQFMGIDNTYQQYAPIIFKKPVASVKSIDYTVDPLDDNNVTNDTSEQTAINNKLDYIDNYNTTINSEENNPTGGMTQANIDNPVANPTDFYGNPIEKEVYSPTFNPMSLVPGFGLMEMVNAPAVPTSGYGTPGTYSGLTGNRFSADSRGIDPITGQYTMEYGTKAAAINSALANPLGDADKAEQGNLRDMEYAAARSELASLRAGTTDPTGNPATTGLDDAAADKVATQLGLDMGFPAHTVAPGTPTHTSLKTGVYTPGSQYSPTGTFTNAPTEGVNTSDPNSTGASTGIGGSASGVSGLGDESGQGTGSSSSSATAGQDTATSGPTGTSYADDAQGSGGGGGK